MRNFFDCGNFEELQHAFLTWLFSGAEDVPFAREIAMSFIGEADALLPGRQSVLPEMNNEDAHFISVKENFSEDIPLAVVFEVEGVKYGLFLAAAPNYKEMPQRLEKCNAAIAEANLCDKVLKAVYIADDGSGDYEKIANDADWGMMDAGCILEALEGTACTKNYLTESYRAIIEAIWNTYNF